MTTETPIILFTEFTEQTDALLKPFADATIDDLTAGRIDTGATARIAGIITDTCRHITKQGRTWMSVTLRDRTGEVEAIAFPDEYERSGGWLTPDALIAFRVRLEAAPGSTTTRVVVERVYDPAAEVEDPLSGYGPDNGLYALTDYVLREASGEVLADYVPRQPEDSSQNAIFGAVAGALRAHLAVLMVQAAQKYRAGRPDADDAHVELGVRPQWLPSRFFYSLARKMAGVVWPNYTGEQRDRMSKIAARACERNAAAWLVARTAPRKVQLTEGERDAMPRAMRWELTSQAIRATEERRRSLMLAAYLETHPVGEIRKDDIDELLLQVNQGLPVECPFF